MAKTRVKDLAREFKLDYKEVITRLREMNIEVANYLSFIDEPQLSRAREALAKSMPLVEEKMVASNIKRRRALGRPQAVAQPQPAPATEAPVAPVREIPAAEPQPQPAATTEPAPVRPAVLPPKEKKKEVTERAKIISLPERPEPAAPTAAAPTPVPEAVPAPAPEPVSPAAARPAAAPEPETPAQAAPAAPAPAQETPPAAPAAPSEPVVTEVPLAAEASASPAAAAAPTPPAAAPPTPAAPDTSAALKRQKAKKLKKETPARIIALPTPPSPAPEPPAAEVPEKGQEKPGRKPVRIVEVSPPVKELLPPKPLEKEEKKPKAKKKKGKKLTPAEEEAIALKAFRKKEIREGIDLYEEREFEGALPRRKGVKKAVRKMAKPELTVPKAIKRRLKVGDSITVGDLAKKMGIKFSELAKKLMSLGIMATINQPLDHDAAALVAAEFGYEVERAAPSEEELLAPQKEITAELKSRPPVVTIMGHVDHGKTSLLDAIRKSRLIDQEAGGITQHIGAYHVALPNGGEIVFLDTPGHEAFTAMRARGAQVTDIVVLVVAADDGVMPQTLEAINHAKAAGVPLVVAINKIDKPNANPERVKRELAEHGVVPEEWGGDVQFAEISAKKIIGIDDLLEKILLQAEILELKAPVDAPARGHIIEAKLDKGRGPVGTVLVQSGTLKTGDVFVCGLEYGRVRAMFDDQGRRVDKATPSIPVEVQGFSGVPQAGDEFIVVESERQAKQVAQLRQLKQREAAMAKMSKFTLEKLYERFQEGQVKELNLILKADVQGSIEALTQALTELSTKELKVHILHTGTGDISETDIMLASASKAIVIGFNVKANPKAQALAEQEQVDIRFYDVIYNLVNDVKAALVGMLEPVLQERPLGRAEVRQVFHIAKVGAVAGCGVLEGKVERNALVRVRRQKEIIYEGKIASLKRFKEDVKEVLAGYECGIGLDRFSDFQPGDILEVYQLEEVKPDLESLQPKAE